MGELWCCGKGCRGPRSGTKNHVGDTSGRTVLQKEGTRYSYLLIIWRRVTVHSNTSRENHWHPVLRKREFASLIFYYFYDVGKTFQKNSCRTRVVSMMSSQILFVQKVTKRIIDWWKSVQGHYNCRSMERISLRVRSYVLRKWGQIRGSRSTIDWRGV